MTAPSVARRFRYRPAPLPPEKANRLRDQFRTVAGFHLCEHPRCGNRARGRFGIVRLCDTHHAEAMAWAYSMETGGAY